MLLNEKMFTDEGPRVLEGFENFIYDSFFVRNYSEYNERLDKVLGIAEDSEMSSIYAK